MPDVIGFVPATEVHDAPTFATPNALVMAQNSFTAEVNRHPAGNPTSGRRNPGTAGRSGEPEENSPSTPDAFELILEATSPSGVGQTDPGQPTQNRSDMAI